MTLSFGHVRLTKLFEQEMKRESSKIRFACHRADERGAVSLGDVAYALLITQYSMAELNKLYLADVSSGEPLDLLLHCFHGQIGSEHASCNLNSVMVEDHKSMVAHRRVSPRVVRDDFEPVIWGLESSWQSGVRVRRFRPSRFRLTIRWMRRRFQVRQVFETVWTSKLDFVDKVLLIGARKMKLGDVTFGLNRSVARAAFGIGLNQGDHTGDTEHGSAMAV